MLRHLTSCSTEGRETTEVCNSFDSHHLIHTHLFIQTHLSILDQHTPRTPPCVPTEAYSAASLLTHLPPTCVLYTARSPFFSWTLYINSPSTPPSFPSFLKVSVRTCGVSSRQKYKIQDTSTQHPVLQYCSVPLPVSQDLKGQGTLLARPSNAHPTRTMKNVWENP